MIPNRNYYYRVNAIGTEGSSSSEILEIREVDIITGLANEVNADLIKMYPNPSGDFLHLELPPHGPLPEIVEILEVNGKIRRQIDVYGNYFSNLLLIPVHDLQPGTYLLRVTWKDHHSVKRFLRE